jgi:hypothetical protein
VPYNHIRPTAAARPGWLGPDRHSGLPNSGKNLPLRFGPQSSPLPCDLLLKTDFARTWQWRSSVLNEPTA